MSDKSIEMKVQPDLTAQKIEKDDIEGEMRDTEVVMDNEFRQTITGYTPVNTDKKDEKDASFFDIWIKENFYLKVFAAWFTWIFCGTVVYAYRNDLGWARGFYMAVNVGYSIGWGFPIEMDNNILWYSIFHVLVGASAVAAALGFFAQSVVSTSKEWYHVALLEEEIEKAERKSNIMKKIARRGVNVIGIH